MTIKIDPSLTIKYKIQQNQKAGSIAEKAKIVLNASDEMRKENAAFLTKPNRFVEQMKTSLKKLNIL